MRVEPFAAFLAVAEELSFRRAAERLHMATSPLSRHIQDLEADLGVKLFHRTTRQVALTDAGRTLVPHAQNVLAAMDAAARAARAAGGRRVELRLGMRVLSSKLEAELRDTLAAARPGTTVVAIPLDSAAQVRAMLRGELDLAVALAGASSGSGSEELASWPVLEERAAIALPDTRANRSLGVVRPEHVAGLTMISIGSAPAAPIDPATAIADAFRSASAGAMRGSDIIPGGIRSLIAAGRHCAFLPADPESPWHTVVLGAGVILKPLPASFPRIATHAMWRAARETESDLAPFIQGLRIRFPRTRMA